MLRPVGSATVFLVLALAVRAGGQPDPNAKQFATDVDQLNGSWASPKMEFAPGITGNVLLKLELKKDSAVGKATVPQFVSKNGVVVSPGPSWVAELKEKDKKRVIVLAETKGDKRAELAEIAYEVNGDKLKLTSAKTLLFEPGGKPIEMSGEWQRKEPGKK